MKSYFTISLFFLASILGFTSSVSAQVVMANPNLAQLPVVISWDNDGIRITAKGTSDQSANLLKLVPFRYLDQIGNDFIRVALDSRNTPVIIDMAEYYQHKKEEQEGESLVPIPRISVYMPEVTLDNYNEPNSFIIDIINFTKSASNPKQSVMIKGIDLLHVGTDQCAVMASNQNRITVNAEDCTVKHLMLKGGILALDDIEEKIPNLCQKYNKQYSAFTSSDAFVVVKDCDPDKTNGKKHLTHNRELITKYTITDFEDASIAFLNNILITKKGVGLNLKTEYVSNSKIGKKSKKVTYNAYDKYRFFPWYEFINLDFSKYVDETQLLLKDPYNNSYIYNSKVFFTNVELIQFFNELKALISERISLQKNFNHISRN